MKRIKHAATALCLLALGMSTIAHAEIAENDAAERIDNATEVLQQFVNIPENAVPEALLRQAYGIAVIPSVFKISFLGGVQRGKGVLSVRTGKGDWSDPAFITLTGGSIGFQAGVSSTDIILVFKTQRSVDRIANGQISLGGDASVAAGPVGRSVGAATNMSFNAEVYSYSRSRGLFGGVSLGGARLGIDQDANWLFYNQPGIDARTLLRRDSGKSLPQAGQNFVYTLNQYMPPSEDRFNYESNTAPSNAGAGYQNGGQGNGQSNGQNGAQGTSRYNNNTNNGQYNQNGAGSSYNDTGPFSGRSQPYNANNAGSGITVQQSGNNPNYSGGTGQSNGQGNTRGTSDYTGDSSQYRNAETGR